MLIVHYALGVSEFVSTPLGLWLRYGVFSVRKEAKLKKYVIFESNTTSASTLQYFIR